MLIGNSEENKLLGSYCSIWEDVNITRDLD
jgi:hypothetical protein